MKHYICTGGCGGESDKAGVCDAQFCTKEGEPLVECSCDDGLHQSAPEVPKEEDLGDDYEEEDE